MAEGRELPQLEQVTVSARTVHAAEIEPLSPRTQPAAEVAQLSVEDEITARRLRAAE